MRIYRQLEATNSSQFIRILPDYYRQPRLKQRDEIPITRFRPPRTPADWIISHIHNITPKSQSLSPCVVRWYPDHLTCQRSLQRKGLAFGDWTHRVSAMNYLMISKHLSSMILNKLAKYKTKETPNTLTKHIIGLETTALGSRSWKICRYLGVWDTYWHRSNQKNKWLVTYLLQTLNPESPFEHKIKKTDDESNRVPSQLSSSCATS